MGPSRRRFALLALPLGIGAGLVWACQRSLAPEVVEQRLLALQKNAPFARLGLQRRALTLVVEGEARAFELVYLRTGHPRVGSGADPARAPVVLVHGTPGSLTAWVDVVAGGAAFPGLAAGREVVALEVLGHGCAPGPALAFDFQRGADWILAAVEALGLPPAHLVGHSYGGEFAWRAALDRPARFRSLTLIDSAGLPRAPQEFLPEEVALRSHPLARAGWLLNSAERVRPALAPHFEALAPDVLAEFVLACARRASWHAMVDLVRDEEGRRAGELAQLALPTLLLWGERDLAYPPERVARRFAELVPAAELVLVPGAGHYPHQERPALVAAALEAFFAEVER